jgi:hypothetical protein
MPSAKQVKKTMCKDNIEKLHPKRCPVCGSKYLFFDPTAGPIVGGVGDWIHPPNAHPTGAWICLDCVEKAYKNEIKLTKSNRVK